MTKKKKKKEPKKKKKAAKKKKRDRYSEASARGCHKVPPTTPAQPRKKRSPKTGPRSSPAARFIPLF